METIKLQSNQPIAKRKDKVKNWYLIQSGTVIQQFQFSQVKLSKNAIIGVLEGDRFMSDYIAAEETVLAAFPCGNSETLKRLLEEKEQLRRIFLNSAIGQRHLMLCTYSDLYNKTKQFHKFVELMYNEYVTICSKYGIEQESFSKIEHLNPLQMQHKAESWEINNSLSLVRTHMFDYIQLMEKDENLTIGSIMEASAQARRVEQGIGEMESYLKYNKDILISDSENDIFKLFFNLSINAYAKKADTEPVKKQADMILRFAEKLNIYGPRLLNRRKNEYFNYDFENAALTGTGLQNSSVMEADIMSINCLEQILEYAKYSDDEHNAFEEKIDKYYNLPDMTSMDDDAYKLRKEITTEFYDIYYKVFIRAVNNENTLTPVLKMFLNFGFMDTRFIGEENARVLYDMIQHLDLCSAEHIYTIYEWLKCIYYGEKEPSRNEFDMNYTKYLADLKRNGKLTDEQEYEYANSADKKVEFEIHNMFASVNKASYGKVITFSPILKEADLLNSPEKMLVTAEKLENASNEIKKIDYSVFYRQTIFSDQERGVNSEFIMTEVLPDIILMPNAGTKAIMWQETANIKSNTPGRFMFPIFTSVDLNDLMLSAFAHFRWEMCRKIQGVHWNDVSDHSLTAEYCNYMQFYRKNSDLSAEAKEKVKNSLTRARNSYREVFVKDYINWIKYESNESFRLNKVAREILVKYCPFSKAVRSELRTNPMYNSYITKYEAEIAKKYQRYTIFCQKYEKAGGKITPELADNLQYYTM